MKEQIYAKAYEILHRRKEIAEREAFNVEENLINFADYTENEKQINNLTIKCGIALAKKLNIDKEKKEKARLIEIRKNLLAKYGYTEKDLTPKYSCSKCNDTGYIGKEKCQCFKKILTDLLIEDSQLVDNNCSLDNPDQKNAKAYKFAKEFCAKFPNVTRKNIIFSGKTGTGKSYITNAIATALMQKQIPVLLLTSNSLSKKLLDIFLSKEDSDTLEEVLIQQEVLIIDDLGSEPLRKNVTAEYLLSLLNERIFYGKTTIITTNLDYQDLQSRYNERLMSRLADSENFYRIELVGPDKRFNLKK